MAKSTVEKKKEAQFGVDRKADLPWNEKKVCLFKTLKKTGSATAATIAEKSGGKLTARDVRHYGYHAKAAGLVKIDQLEDEGNHYYFQLTAAGAKVDPDAALKAQLDARKSKPKAAAKKTAKKAAPKKAAKKAAKKTVKKAAPKAEPTAPAVAAETTTV